MALICERRLLTPDTQHADRYQRVPFEMPPGTTSVEVRLRYDRSLGVIDLGCEGLAGWRGWSGGARSSFVIGVDDATPGYSPGALEPGAWSVILGLHHVAPEGVPVELDILMPAESPVEHGPLAAAAPATVRGSERKLPAPAGLRWFAGDFHAHTLHSDGTESISQVAARAARAGLDFIALTEHNTVSHHRHLPSESRRQGITLIPGQEITTHRGHANAFGDIGFVDFRQPGQAWMDEVTRRGGLFSVNHPIAGDCSWLFPLDRAPDAVELWHSTWYADLQATSALAWYAAWAHRAALVGGSDFHTASQAIGPGTPTTWVAAEDASIKAILAGVAAGRTAIMGTVTPHEGVTVPDLLTAPVLLRLDGEVVAIDGEGLVLVDGRGQRRRVVGREARYEADPEHGPYCLVYPDRRLAALCS